ncbi:MAG: VWA domain-containing protein [Hyphomicrobiales bacterium]|nr:MAG: VWA domain-containing protein [Hyphomicrobiales bacterium]
MLRETNPFAETGPSKESGKFADNIVHFGRVLRAAGLPVGPSRVVDAVRAVEVAGIRSREDLFWTLHAVFVSKHEHHVVFEAAFDMFWRTKNLLEKMLEVLSPSAKVPTEPEKPKAAAARVSQAMMQQQIEQREEMLPDIEIDAKYTVSGKEVLQSKDFAQMNAAEIAAAKQAMARMVLPVSKVKTRRCKAAPHGPKIDMRRTLRASLATGGEWVKPVMKRPRIIQPPIVALCDISGSMSQYSRLFLHFLHALAESQNRVHSFVFGTQLTNITRALARKDPDEALEACGASVQDWSGGTRIATALHAFNRDWSRRVLGQGAIVLLITDGLERDSDEDLGFEMERLQKSCRQLIWLNPLLRYDKFEAKASGVRAMLPYVDQFRSVHSLDAIGDLCESLSKPGSILSSDPKSWLTKAA